MESMWYFPEVLSLMEGGNTKFKEFCALTNSYPTLQSAVDDRTQFLDALYSCNSVKAYRSLLRRAVAKVENDRSSLIKSNLSSQGFFPNVREVEPSTIENFTTYTKELRMLSGEQFRCLNNVGNNTRTNNIENDLVYEFYTEVLGKHWPHEFDSMNQKNGNESKFKRSTNRIASEANGGESFSRAGTPTHSAEEENDKSLSLHQKENEKISKKHTGETNGLSVKEDENDVLQEEFVSSNTKNRRKPNARSKRPRQLSQPLSAVPELKSMVDTDDFSTLSSSNDPVNKIPSTRDDDASVMSFGSLAASSVGSLSLRSVDSCSVASADLEPLPEINKDDELIKKLEPKQSENFKKDDESGEPDATYGPHSTDTAARNILELEKLSKSQANNDEERSIGDSSNDGVIKRSSLESTMGKLTKSLNEASVLQEEASAQTREKGKTIGFKGLPFSPPERKTRRRISRVRPIDNGGGTRDDFQRGRRKKNASLTQNSLLPRQRNSLNTKPKDGNLSRLTKRTEKSDYAPLISHSLLQRAEGYNQNLPSKDEETQAPLKRMSSAYMHQWKRLSRSFDKQRQNSFGKNDNSETKREDGAGPIQALNQRGQSLDENQLRVLLRRSSLDRQETGFVPSTSQRNLSESDNWPGRRLLSQRFNRQGSKDEIQGSQYGFDKDFNLAPKREDEVDFEPFPTNRRKQSEDENSPQLGLLLRVFS